ncbi:MAG TPA: hypothetical protein VN442_18485 [Bryobacteraceae bacterium]|nr:hypothetical protein [Bryobacteraceae bacterium]
MARKVDGFEKKGPGRYESEKYVIEKCNRYGYQWVLRNKKTGKESWQYTLRGAIDAASSVKEVLA